MTSSKMLIAIVLALAVSVKALDNGLARTPALAWNSWNYFACSVNETLIQEIADALVSTGLLAVGYNHLNIDDCWAYARYPNGTIEPDPTTFPSGMAALADYVHSKGLLFGLYSDAGEYTCQKRPGSLFHEDTDASTYASWGVDYLKYDNCYNLDLPVIWRYQRMRDALNATNDPIYFSMCEWGVDDPWTWAADYGNSWRVAGDIQDNWDSLISIIEVIAAITNYTGPGGWNDPDMLEVGNGGMTTTEYQLHFALWAFTKAPLVIGCDIRNMTNDTISILMNTEIIAVNQDPLGKPVSRVWTVNNNTEQVWAGPLTNGTAVLLVNEGESAVNITAPWSMIGVSGSQNVRDLYAQQNLGSFTESFTGTVQPHGVMALVFTSASEEIRS